MDKEVWAKIEEEKKCAESLTMFHTLGVGELDFRNEMQRLHFTRALHNQLKDMFVEIRFNKDSPNKSIAFEEFLEQDLVRDYMNKLYAIRMLKDRIVEKNTIGGEYNG